MKDSDFFLLASASLLAPHINYVACYVLGFLCTVCVFVSLWRGK